MTDEDTIVVDRRVLEELLVRHAETVASLEALLGGASEEWITIREAERRFRITNRTARRWTSRPGVARKGPSGKWELNASKIRRGGHENVRNVKSTDPPSRVKLTP